MHIYPFESHKWNRTLTLKIILLVTCFQIMHII